MTTRTMPRRPPSACRRRAQALAEVETRGGECRDDPDHDPRVEDPSLWRTPRLIPTPARRCWSPRTGQRGTSPRGILPPFPSPPSPRPLRTPSSRRCSRADEGEPVIVPLDVRSTVIPARYPITGIRNWNSPKWKARRKVWRPETGPQDDPRGDRHGEGVHGQPTASRKRQRVDRNLPRSATIEPCLNDTARRSGRHASGQLRNLFEQDRRRHPFGIFRLEALEKRRVARSPPPFSIKVLLENSCATRTASRSRRTTSGRSRTTVEGSRRTARSPFAGARALQDFTGVPALVDLAAMPRRGEADGGDPKRINPLMPRTS